jgi:hypothetical protein
MKGSVHCAIKKKGGGGREGGKRSQCVSVRGDRGLCVPFNFAVVFDFNLFPVPTSKSQFIGNVLMNRQNAAIRSMASFLFYNAHCLLTH